MTVIKQAMTTLVHTSAGPKDKTRCRRECPETHFVNQGTHDQYIFCAMRMVIKCAPTALLFFIQQQLVAAT